MLEDFSLRLLRGMSIGVTGFEADRNRLVIGLEKALEGFFSSER